jgi:hypothetical protein
VATDSSFEQQIKNKEADWKGRLQKRFRLSKMRMEFGRWCYIVYPIEGGSDYMWWEWETKG